MLFVRDSFCLLYSSTVSNTDKYPFVAVNILRLGLISRSVRVLCQRTFYLIILILHGSKIRFILSLPYILLKSTFFVQTSFIRFKENRPTWTTPKDVNLLSKFNK